MARNIEVLRNYFLGKDPQLKETLADNSLRLCGIKGKYYVLRDELVAKLKELKDYVIEKDEELKDYVDEQDGLLEDAIEGLIERVEAIENDFVTEEELASALLSYYTKSEVDALIATIPRFKVEVVVSLPTHDISTTTLYLVPSQDPETRNVYDEFIYVNNTWEQVGTTAVDMSNYYTKSEVDGKIFFNILTADVEIPDDSEINPLSGLTTGWYYTGTHKVYFENSDPNDPLVSPGGIFFLNMTSGNQYFWVGPVNTLGSGGQLGMWGYFDDIALEWVYGGYDILDSAVGISSTSTDQQLATAKAIYSYIQSLNIATITDITTSTFSFAHVDTDEGFYSLPANCTIDFGEMNGSPVTYTTVSPVLVQVVKESGGHVKHAMFTDIQSDGVYYIYGTTTYPALTGTVVQKKLTNTIEYIRVNGSFVPVTNTGIADITVPSGEGDYIDIDNGYINVVGIVPKENETVLNTWESDYFIQGSVGQQISVTALSDYEYCTYENTGSAGTFKFRLKGAIANGNMLYVTDSSDIITTVDYNQIQWTTEHDIEVAIPAGGTAYFQFSVDPDYPSIVKLLTHVYGVLDDYVKFTDTFGGTDGVSNGTPGAVPAPQTGDSGKFLKADGTWGTPSGGDYSGLSNKPSINSITLEGNKTSKDLKLDMVVLSYGNSTWQDFINAYNRNAVVYCRASSNPNPAEGTQTRMAFMAYVSNATTPTSVEFQYYRSVSTHSASQQGDQVFVYKLTSSGVWTVEVRETYSKVVAGTNVSTTYSNGEIEISATDTTYSDFVGTDGQTAGTHGLVPAPATSETDKFLKSDGTWGTPPGTTYTAGTNVQISAGVISATDTTYSAFTGATSSVAGSAGLVPAPTTSDPDKFLKGDGTWDTPAGGGATVTYGTTAMTPGVSTLNDGDIYIQYE